MSWSWVFSFSGQLGSEKAPGGQALVNQFSLRAALIKQNRISRHISKRFFPPPPARSLGGIFLLYLLWESGYIPGGKAHSINCDWVCLMPFNSQAVRTEPPAIRKTTIQISYPNTGVCSGEPSPVFDCLSPSWEQMFTLCPPLSCGSRKR